MTIMRRCRPSQTARFGLLLLGLWITAAGPGALCWGGSTDSLEARLTKTIDDARIKPELTALGDRTLVTLRGDVETDLEKTGLLARAHKALSKEEKKTVEIRDRIFVKSPGPPGPKPETDLWVLTYIHSGVHSTAPGSTAVANTTPDPVDTLVDALNSIYTSGDVPAVQRAGLGRLLLNGTREQIVEIKRLLALIDAPWPQVQLNMWAIQVSGAPKDISSKLRDIGKEVRAARDQMTAVQQKLAKLVGRADLKNMTRWNELDASFKAAGIDLPHDGSLSLNESLIFLTLDPERGTKAGELRKLVCPGKEKMGEKSEKTAPEVAPLGCQDPNLVPFHHLAAIFGTESCADRQSFHHFGRALHCFRNGNRCPGRLDAPRNLVRTGVTVDRVLKAVMDAFSEDMNDLILDPLLDRIEDLGGGGRGEEGVALVGRTRIVVTSGLEAGLAPEMASFVESGRPKPFGKDLLEAAFPSSKTGETTKTDVLTGANKILAGLSNAQALGLAAILSADTQPAYTKVAPGIAVNIRPTVLPDGGAARLTVDARFGVVSTPLEEARTDVWRQAPPAGITSHDIRTDAVVSAFDLFDISSFSVEASHPQTPFYIPILGRLPIIGPAFQIPRHNKTTHFDSLVLVNTVILPRSIELHRFYGLEDQEDRQDIKELDCHEEPLSSPKPQSL